MSPARAVAVLAVLQVATACAGTRHTLSPAEHETLRGQGPLPLVQTDPRAPDPASVLRRRAQALDPRDDAVGPLVERLRATLEQSGGVGLAAPQVGVSRRVVLVKLGTRPATPQPRVEAWVNPVLEWSSPDTQEDYEGCLSLDGVGGLVRRPRQVRVRYARPGGETVVQTLGDWDARIAQHELDHLDGVLYVDKLEDELLSAEEARARRTALHRARGWLPPEPPPAATPVSQLP